MAFAEPAADIYSQSVVEMDRQVSPHRVYLIVDDGEGKHVIPFIPCTTDVMAKAQYADVLWAIKTAYLAGVSKK